MLNIRPATAAELPQLKDLWKKCFGDPNTYIDIFYQKFCTPEQVLVVEDSGDVDSMVAMLPSTLQLPNGTEIPIGYAYTLATNPYIQGKGHARQLLKYADQYLQENGYKAMSLVPASPSLHRFFEALGMDPFFATRKVEVLASSLNGDTTGCSLSPVSPHEYNEIRESYLKGTLHITYTDKMIQFQQIGSHIAYGDLYKVEVNGITGCTAIEYVQSRRLLMKELLLPPEHMMQAVEVVASQLEASRYHIRTPAFWDGISGSYQQAFGVMKWYDRDLQAEWFTHRDAYMGLGFD